MKWTGFDFIPIAIMFYACSWLFSNLKGNSVLTNIDDLRFAAVGVTAPDETIFHPIPPVRVEGQGPHLRLLVDVGSHSRIGQQLEKGLVSRLPLPVHLFGNVVGQGHWDEDDGHMEKASTSLTRSLLTVVAEPYRPVELIDIYIYIIIVYVIFLS
jgi:hypothetical protein